MRIRTIKPEFWANEDLASLHVKARLLAIGLLNYADDEGYFNANANLIRGSIFPYDPEIKSVEKGLLDLERIGYVKLVQSNSEKRIGMIVNFKKHQNVNRPYPSKLSIEFCSLTSSCSDSVSNHGTFTEHSVNAHGAITAVLGTGNRESSLSLTTCAHAHEGGGKYPENVEDVIELARSIGEAMSYDEAETYFIERAKLDWKTCKGVKIQRVDFDLKAWCKKKQQERYDRKSKEPKKPEAYGVEAI